MATAGEDAHRQPLKSHVRVDPSYDGRLIRESRHTAAKPFVSGSLRLVFIGPTIISLLAASAIPEDEKTWFDVFGMFLILSALVANAARLCVYFPRTIAHFQCWVLLRYSR